MMKFEDLTNETKEELLAHAKDVFPHECCGVLLNSGQVLRGTNTLVSLDDLGATDAFILDQATIDRAALFGGIKAFYHSHPYTSEKASDADLAGCTHSNYPWVIVSPLTHGFNVINPSNGYIAPILKRPFLWGVMDCYKLVVDIYKQELNIELPNDCPRGELFAWERDPNWTVLEDNFERAGFVTLRRDLPLQKYDLLLMAMNSPFGRANHCALYYDPDKNQIIHHPLDSLSRLVVYGGWYKDITKFRLRHKNLM